MTVNGGALQITAPTIGAATVTLTSASGVVPVAYSDMFLTTTTALPFTVAAGQVKKVYLQSAGTYTLSVKVGGIEGANPSSGTTITFDISHGETASYNYASLNYSNATAWSVGSGGGGGLVPANNLSDLVSPATARTNLGLGTAATTAATAYLATANNLSDVTASTARTNLGLGPWSAATANLYHGYTPSTNGLLLAVDDPSNITNSNTLGTGTLALVAIPVTTAVTVANFWYGIGTAATTPTAGQNFVGIYGNRSANTINLLGASGDQTSNFGGGNIVRSAALTVQGGQSLTLPAGSTVWAAFLFNGTTSPQVYRVGSLGIMSNLNLAAPSLRSMSFGSALTALPATIDLTTATSSSPYWAGLS